MLNIALLTFHDLATAARNKTLCLVLFAPLFIVLVMTLIDHSDSRQSWNIGLLRDASYPPDFIEALSSMGNTFRATYFTSIGEADRWLKSRSGDGVLLPSAGGDSMTIEILDRTSVASLGLVEGVQALQQSREETPGWVGEVRYLRDTVLERQMLPAWILMLVLLVGFIVLPAQVAEEKEKRLLLGILQTPVRELEWLIAKVFAGILLVALAVVIFQLLAGYAFSVPSLSGYLVFTVAGAFCFGAIGVLIGLLCRTQASARTLGVMVYIPHLLPSALSDYSSALREFEPWIPSSPLYLSLRALILEEGSPVDFLMQLAFLSALGLIALLLAYGIVRKRHCIA